MIYDSLLFIYELDENNRNNLFLVVLSCCFISSLIQSALVEVTVCQNLNLGWILVCYSELAKVTAFMRCQSYL